jgi:hypothetical protein
MSRFRRFPFHLASVLVALSLLASACASQNYVELSTDDPVAELAEGIAVSANPKALPADFGVQLAAVPADDFASQDEWRAAQAALPANLRLAGPVFQVATRGELPEQVFLSVALPAGATGAYDLYAWNGTAWDFVPAQPSAGQLVATLETLPSVVALFQPAALPPLTLVGLEPGQALSPAAAETANAVLLGGVLAQADGSLGGQVPGLAETGTFAVYPVVRNDGAGSGDPGLIAGLLTDAALRAQHLQSLVAFVIAGQYDGVVLDYAGVGPDLGPAYAQFVHDLAAQLHGQGKSLLVQVEPAVADGQGFNTGGYDWRALGAAVDALLVPAPADPTQFGSGQADRLLAWAAGEVPRGRLRWLLSARSVEGHAGGFSLLDQPAALAPLGLPSLEPSEAIHTGDQIAVKLSGQAEALTYDPAAFAASYTYQDSDGAARTVWLTSADSLRQRLALAQRRQLGGAVVTDLLAPGTPLELFNALAQYKAGRPAAEPPQADVLWTVKQGESVLALATAQPDQPYLYVAPAAGLYEFSASLQAGGGVPLGSVAVQVAEVLPTETPTPTATATRASTGGQVTSPQATAQPTTPGSTPAPTATNPPSDSGVFVPPAPIGAGTFELGGQVPGFISHAAQMQQAGMKWVKFQVRGGGADLVAAGKAAGFKVLLSVIGDKSRVTDPAYQAEYAAWVAGLAAAGADAIEVWNEPNIDHEWPEGQISAASYAQLLAKAYTAIKGANGGTIVISGGPAPTGAEGAFPGRVVNDDRFMRELAAAGGANYMDCIGIHYNTGTTSPNATSGSALSGYHYSYYFWSMVDTYWNAFGGTRPLCFTELGYLSPEGFGSLSSHFGWAADTTVSEHAQWLAEAASLGGNSGKVRLMIVWNVDFTNWGNDPQAGYAIIRPDGSCPACSTLGAVVP